MVNIRLTEHQSNMILDWYRPIVLAHREEYCEPPGYKIEIETGLPGHYPVLASVVCGDKRLDLGEVQID